VLKYRLTLGPLLIAFLIAICWFDQWLQGRPIPAALQHLLLQREPAAPPGLAIFFVMVAASILASRELARILRDKGILASKRITTTASLTGVLVSTIVPADWPATLGVAAVSSAAVGVFVLSLGFYSRHRTVQGTVAAAGGTLLSFVYLGLMFGFILAIRREHTVWVLLWVILVTKSSDIGAFATGKLIGRHKMILWLSPGKTWEGFFGGVALAAAIGAIGLLGLAAIHRVQGMREPVPPAWTGAAAGILFGVTAVMGDLIASLFKRDAGIKDSSSIIPGFGGILDVIDSPLLVAPVAFWWVHFVHRAGW
jgi:phosphatidate cytidylyltransferase